MPRALLSVSDKTGLVELGRGLAARGFELVSTGGTARALADAGLPVTNVSDVTGFPEMMDGRVKTLHPRVTAASSRGATTPTISRPPTAHGIGLDRLVVVNLYPFVKTAANPATPFDDAHRGDRHRRAEHGPRGGQELPRTCSSSSTRPTTPRCSRRSTPGGPTPAFRFDLHAKAFAHTAAYDTAIARDARRRSTSTASDFVRGRRRSHAAPRLVARRCRRCAISATARTRISRRRGTRRSGGRRASARAQILQGKELSYTNLLDLDCRRAHRRSSSTSRRPSSSSTPTRAARRPGHRPPTPTCARARPTRSRRSAASSASIARSTWPRPRRSSSTFIEAVIAPGGRRGGAADPGEEGQHARRHRRLRRALERPAASELRSILGAVLVQERDVVVGGAAAVDRRRCRDGLTVVTKRQPTADEWQALRFAWRVCAHVKSNTVIFTSADRTLAIGAGQMSRVDAVNVARHEGAASGRPRPARAARSRPRMRSSRSATASTPSPPPAPPPSCSRADRCATPRSSPPPTSTASRWCSRAGGTSGTDSPDSELGMRSSELGGVRNSEFGMRGTERIRHASR